MSVYLVCFSPTGGTDRVMELLTAGWKVDCRIDLSVPEDVFDYAGCCLTEEDLCLVGVPSFGGRVPAVALERLKRLRVNGTAGVAVVAFGNRAFEDTLLELKNVMADCGFRIVAAAAAVAEHSIMRQFGAGRPDAQDAGELREFGDKVKNCLSVEKELFVPGNMPYREYNGVPFKPKGDKSCTGCGLCAEKCPVGAIPKDRPSAVDTEACISCMRCVSVCPRKARNLNKLVLAAASAKMKKAFEGRKRNEFFI